jgi:putative transposase
MFFFPLPDFHTRLVLIMHFEPNRTYHIYNLGINRQPIFFCNDHYRFFLRKIRIEWNPFTDIISYCLLPTQFHFILRPNHSGCIHLQIQEQFVALQKLSQMIGHTLSSYTKAVNKPLDRIGCLFHKKTRQTELSYSMKSPVDKNDLIFRIKEINAKPVLLNLCKYETDWKFSSAKEYVGLSNVKMCRTEILQSRFYCEEL